MDPSMPKNASLGSCRKDSGKFGGLELLKMGFGAPVELITEKPLEEFKQLQGFLFVCRSKMGLVN